MKKSEKPIALLDSGVGGLTVAREIVRHLPAEEIIYYGDTLHLPYGPRPLTEVRKFVFQIIDFLIQEKEAKAIVLACNTATSAALDIVKKKYNLPIFGTIKSVTRSAYNSSNNKKIGVIGTTGTINSQAYQKSLHKLDPQLKVFATACPRFVELVEQGRFDDSEVETIARKYLAGLIEVNIDVLILGCTHYPYLIPVIKRVMGKGVKLVSSGGAMAQEVSKVLAAKKLLRDNGKGHGNIGEQEFIVSENDRISKLFLEKGRKYLNLPTLEFKEKNIFT